jgi:hypothetical protein
MIEVLKCALASANLNERHQTIAESYYWLRQYKLLAEKAIAELESQEPVAKLKTSNVLLRCHRCGYSDKLNMQIEYTSQPQRTWVGLTDKELDDLHRVLKIRLMGTFEIKDIYRAVEQQLKEKNT